MTRYGERPTLLERLRRFFGREVLVAPRFEDPPTARSLEGPTIYCRWCERTHTAWEILP